MSARSAQDYFQARCGPTTFGKWSRFVRTSWINELDNGVGRCHVLKNTLSFLLSMLNFDRHNLWTVRVSRFQQTRETKMIQILSLIGLPLIFLPSMTFQYLLCQSTFPWFFTFARKYIRKKRSKTNWSILGHLSYYRLKYKFWCYMHARLSFIFNRDKKAAKSIVK